MAFLNKNRKIYLGILAAGVVGYIVYRKMGTKGTTNFTGRKYANYTGNQYLNCDGCRGNCGGCKGMSNFTGYLYAEGAGKAEIRKELARVHRLLAHEYALTAEDIRTMREHEAHLRSML